MTAGELITILREYHRHASVSVEVHADEGWCIGPAAEVVSGEHGAIVIRSAPQSSMEGGVTAERELLLFVAGELSEMIEVRRRKWSEVAGLTTLETQQRLAYDRVEQCINKSTKLAALVKAVDASSMEGA